MDEPPAAEASYNEPYFGGPMMSGPLNGIHNDSLTVQGPRMELVVSEGEDEEDDDDIVVLRPSPSTKADPNNQDVEKVSNSALPFPVDCVHRPFRSCLPIWP